MTLRGSGRGVSVVGLVMFGDVLRPLLLDQRHHLLGMLLHQGRCGRPLLFKQFPLDGLRLLLTLDGQVLFGLVFLLVVLDGQNLDVFTRLAFAQLALELGGQFLQLNLPFFLEAMVDLTKYTRNTQLTANSQALPPTFWSGWVLKFCNLL